MPVVRPPLAGLIVGVLVVCSACADPPTKEMQEAQQAIDAARAAGADEYAHDEYAAATRALTSARAAAAEHDYRLALNNALDSRERAQNASTIAADQQAAAQSGAQRALITCEAALATARTRLKAAEAARVAGPTLTRARRTILDAERRVQEARTAFDHASYRDASSIAAATTADLSGITRGLDAATTGALRRRR